MCNKCSVISVSEFKLVNSIIENMSELQDTKHPVKETKAAIERKAPKETKEKKNGYISQPQSNQNSQKPKHQWYNFQLQTALSTVRSIARFNTSIHPHTTIRILKCHFF